MQKINSCFSCDYFKVEDESLCVLADRRIQKLEPIDIPEWCPLPEWGAPLGQK
jgi:hypothetical protein